MFLGMMHYGSFYMRHAASRCGDHCAEIAAQLPPPWEMEAALWFLGACVVVLYVAIGWSWWKGWI